MKWCWKQLEGRYSKLFKLYIIYSIDKYRQSSYLSKKKNWGYYFLELQTHTHKNPHVYEAFIEPDTFSCYYWNKMPCYFSLPFWNVRLQSERIYGKSHNWTWIMKWYNDIIITIRSLCTFYCIFNVDKKNVSRKPLIMHKQCKYEIILCMVRVNKYNSVVQKVRISKQSHTQICLIYVNIERLRRKYVEI